MNNTHIMRGFHVIVKDYDMNIINNDYGIDGGPLDDARTSPGKIMWFRPHKDLGENHTCEEPLPYYKKTHFLPRCVRELEYTEA
jgi:hypothetical protein